MPRALNLLRTTIHYRRAAFDQGLEAAGYSLKGGSPRPGDALVVWNRYDGNHERASEWERAGGEVFVVENGWLGKHWLGREWFTLCKGHHSGAGEWTDGGPSRWDAWAPELAPWTTTGTETLILGQRGIGEPNIRSPDQWAEKLHKKVGGRLRPHPGKIRPKRTLDDDFSIARCALTWHSGAALLALLAGVPVFYDFPRWIGAEAGKPMASFLSGEDPMTDDALRLSMFRRLAWSMWTLDEIATGEPFLR